MHTETNHLSAAPRIPKECSSIRIPQNSSTNCNQTRT
uniref:Uncharacterized protein n=1 Tax=Arundo donax TaxID=35708 RepID=A0A0A8Y0Z6_ARUDO